MMGKLHHFKMFRYAKKDEKLILKNWHYIEYSEYLQYQFKMFTHFDYH